MFFATRNGTVKKTLLEAYSRPRQAGIWAIQLDEDDELVAVGLSRPGDTIVLGTAKGKSIHFDESAARAMGRQAHGVRGIKLLGKDKVIGMLVAHDPGATVLTACEHGHGKRTPLADYPIKNRGGQGVINIKTGGRNGDVVSVALASTDDDVMYITQSGMIVRSPVNDMRPMGRGTQGVRLINLKDEDRLVALGVVRSEDKEMFDEESTEGATAVTDDEGDEPVAPEEAGSPDDLDEASEDTEAPEEE